MKFFYLLLLVSLSQLGLSQTNPTRFNLSGGNYTFTSWAATASAGTYPSNMVFHFTNDPTGGSYSPTANGNEDFDCAYNLTSRNRFKGTGSTGFSMLATSDPQYNNCSSGTADNGRYVGAAVLGLNSTGVSGITVAWTGRTISASARTFVLKLQYRVGTSGGYTNVSSTQYTSSSAGNSASFSQTLPAACNGQANLFVRWVYYQTVDGANTRPELAVDDITVSTGGTGGGGAAILTFDFNPATTARLNPPFITGTINDPADPARVTGIITSVKDNGIDMPAADYSITASSANTGVVTNANVIITKSNGTALVKIIPTGVGYSDITLTLAKGADSKTLVIGYAASQSPTASKRWPGIIADASAAVAIDDNYMIVANDETNALYVYNRSESGLPYVVYDYNQGNVLQLTDGAPAYKEVDVEAGVRGKTNTNRIFWLGSMSNSVNFNDKPNRNRLFAVTTSGTGAATTFANAGHYSNLRTRLIAWGDANGYNFTASAADGKDSKVIDGFNIEGMVFAPNNTTMYIGFRAPLVPTSGRTKAVIAPLLNFESWFNNGSPAGNPTFGSPIELNLNGRGIRDMIRQTNGSYIIVAGNYDNDPLIPALYRWSGVAGVAPEALPLFVLAGNNAEGIMEVFEGGVASTTKYQVISDKGTEVYYADGIEAKDLAQMNHRKFSSEVFDASGVLPLTFAYIKALVQGKNAVVSWNFQQPADAVSYDVEFAADGIQFQETGTVAATSFLNEYSYSFAFGKANAGYYRVKANLNTGQVIYSAIKFIGINAGSQEFSVSPNPVANNFISIRTDKTGLKQGVLIDSHGAVCKRFTFAGNMYTLDVTAFSAGQYFAKLIYADQTVQSVLIIKN